MKIVTIVRTLNEEINIERFCQAYDWADLILIADENSTDRTKELALSFPNVKFASLYKPEIPLRRGGFRTSHSTQINFLIDWAKEEGADWMLFDDCDCWPNPSLKKHLRWILENSRYGFVSAVRLYLWGKHEYFPSLSRVKGIWTPSLYGWRSDTGLRCVENYAAHQEFIPIPIPDETETILPPMCLLHNPWQNDAMVTKKLDFYRSSGLIPSMENPTAFGGPLEILPVWAREDIDEN